MLAKRSFTFRVRQVGRSSDNRTFVWSDRPTRYSGEKDDVHDSCGGYLRFIIIFEMLKNSTWDHVVLVARHYILVVMICDLTV